MAKADDLTPPKGVRFRRAADGFIIRATTRSREGVYLSTVALVVALQLVIATAQYSIWHPMRWFFLLCVPIVGSVSGMLTMGNVAVVVSAGTGRIFVGIGGIGASRRVDWSAITRVREDSAEVATRSGDLVRWTRIVLCGENIEVLLVPRWLDAMLPPMLSDAQRRYIVDVLRALVEERIALEHERARSGPYR